MKDFGLEWQNRPLEFNRQSTVPNFRHCALCACWLLTSTISSSSSSSSPLLLLPREKSLLPSLSNISLLFCRFCTLSYVCIKDHVVIRSLKKKNWTFFPLCVCVCVFGAFCSLVDHEVSEKGRMLLYVKEVKEGGGCCCCCCCRR